MKLEQWNKSERKRIEETGKLIGLQIPLADFGTLPAAFGKPRWSAGTEGQYSPDCGGTAKIAGASDETVKSAVSFTDGSCEPQA